jgi:glycosyltransferase involved in cell wall biosynthesis
MKISGFTIIRNAVMNDYPVLEAIKSILPVVDEMVVLVGDSTDETLALIESIGDPKIKIHHSIWDTSLRSGGAVLAVETNKAFQLIDPSADWAFYIQGDEAVHEQYHAAIREACLKYKDDSKVEGLLFKYLHFYGTYDYVGDSRKWYHREVRVIKNNKAIHAYKDAQGFRVGESDRKIAVKPSEAYIYHYGWVKSLEQMIQKQKYVSQFWVGEDQMQRVMEAENFFDFSDFDSLAKFTGTHPSVMKERIASKNLQVDLDIQQKKFSLKEKFLYHFEKMTGIRPFDFKNYKVIR